MPELHLSGPHRGKLYFNINMQTSQVTHISRVSFEHPNPPTRAKQLEASIKYVPLKLIHNVNSLASTITPNKVSKKRQKQNRGVELSGNCYLAAVIVIFAT